MEDINDSPISSQNSILSSINDLSLEDVEIPELSDRELKVVIEKIAPLKQVRANRKKIFNRRERTRRKIIKKKAKRRLPKKPTLADLQKTIDEYSASEGDQVVVLMANSSNRIYNICGSESLKNVVKQTLFKQFEINTENASVSSSSEIENDPNCSQVSSIVSQDFKLVDLPVISVDGKPTSLNKMSNKNMQKFIEELLKCTTGGQAFNWKKKCNKPEWWPSNMPWLSIHKDHRTQSEREKISFSEALRNIITNCYKFYNREDILNSSITQTKNSVMNNNPNSIDIKYNFMKGTNNNDFEKIELDLSNENQSFFDNDGQLVLKFNNAYFDTKNGIINVPVPLSVYKSITERSQNNPNRCISVSFNEKEK